MIRIHPITRRSAHAAAAALILGASLVSALPALAQDQPQAGPPQAQRGRMMGRMLMSITPPLSDDQKNRIRQLRSDMQKQNANVTDREQRRANAKAFYDKINGVLSPAQQADFKSKMTAMRAKYRASHPDASGTH